MHTLLRATTCVLIASLFIASGAAAGTVTATVTGKSGQALANAVVTLEAVGAHLTVKPMAGVEIAQNKRKFIPAVTVVSVGTPVTFPNVDTVRHHVYSFSAAKPFELKLYAGTPSAPIVFDKPGIVVIGCNIHDQMTAWVVVVDTPYHARSGADGSARIEGVAPGRYRLRAWHTGLAADAPPPSIAAEVAAGDIELAIRLEGVNTAP